MLIDFLPDSDCMYLENNTAWFVSRLYNILFKMNLESGCYEYVSMLSEYGIGKCRFHPICVKYEKKIYCLPDFGTCVWIYNLENGQYEQINIANPDNERIKMKCLGIYHERLYTISLGLKQIIVINLKNQEIESTYLLTDNKEEELSENNIIIEKKIYGILNSSKTCIYEFDLVSKKIDKAIISDKKTFYNTISFDGDKFWLSGAQKEILIWNKKSGNVEYISGFTKYLHNLNFAKGCVEKVDNSLGIYEPLFSKSLFLSKKIWFIPFRTDKIIYIDKDTHEVQELPLLMEEEDELSIRKRGDLCNYKFFLEFIIAQRYMVIYSLKMECHYVIDTLTMNVTKESFKFSMNNAKDLLNICKKDKVFWEADGSDCLRYKISLIWGKDNSSVQVNKIGKSIYQKIADID